jgi:hypothetical protein
MMRPSSGDDALQREVRSGQKEFCDEAGFDEGTYASWELGLFEPGADDLERGDEVAGVGPEYGDEVLLLDEVHRRKRQRPGRSPEEVFAGLREDVER